ncbi:ABC transporter permease [Bacillus sp. FJAT-27264]|uniref:carbohydrate ABC transporter permease n=1 Tax=Paenibacillus sp. (strain DSM 101736 / FJAT-27264) TaxID=1850362 RepID=UPI000807C2B1|nr:sugar ABC transporter permease [Bacillus sp. FJAT-27264]OBZ14980.1 ABC transporter permease [Bacillus sp. FJAT-27264]
MNQAIRPSRKAFVLYMLPGFALYTFIVLVPIVLAFYYGFFEWSGGTKMTFIGLDNFIALSKDEVFIQSFINNIYLTLLCIVGQIGLAFLFALLLNTKRVWFKSVHRTMIYFPSVLSAVVIGFIWTMLYDYNYGLINIVLKFIGQGEWAQPWLNNESLSLTLVAIPLIWQYVGYYVIIILSALAAVDPQVLEMAEIDGASSWKKAMHITLPLIKNTLVVCVTLCIAGTMKVFDHIYVMTNGGPGTSSNVMALNAYKTSFLTYKMGYGSAMSIGILILSLIFVAGTRWLLLSFTKEREVQ